jgi:hypothetical protein
MLDFNANLKGLDGQEIKDEKNEVITLGKMLANQLAFTGKGDALKLFNWAQKMYNGEVLDLDKSDEGVLKEFIKNNEQLTVLAKAQLLTVFKD